MKKDFTQAAQTVQQSFQAATAAPAPVEDDKSYKRINGRLSLGNYVDLKRGATLTGLSMSEFLDYGFGVFVQEHPEIFTDPDAARAVAVEVLGGK